MDYFETVQNIKYMRVDYNLLFLFSKKDFYGTNLPDSNWRILVSPQRDPPNTRGWATSPEVNHKEKGN